jgi:hypothetical protein
MSRCAGRFAVKMSWAEIVALYKLTVGRPPHNFPPRYNVCPQMELLKTNANDVRRRPARSVY